MTDNYIEWIGYAAMASLMVAFTMKNMKTLRIINTLGAVLFIIYGFLIHSYPIIITNAFISMVNIYYLLIKKTT